jgi:hypothetical protein
MKAKLICYDLSKLDITKKTIVKRLLFGYTEYSNNAQYTYEREGILEKIPHIKPARAVVIVKPQNEGDIKQILNLIFCHLFFKFFCHKLLYLNTPS